MLQAADEPPGHPVAIAVVDDHGDLVYFVCMAGASPAVARHGALKKANTSACMRPDTTAYGARLATQGVGMASLPQTLTGGPGGLVIARSSDGAILGGIGVCGRSGEEDDAIGQAGLRALGSL
jgi:uncharacterized protein GlcG (DUF336 family)